SLRPSPQRTSIATLRFSIQPSSRRRCTKTVIHGPQLEGVAEPRNPMVGSFDNCCARAASGQRNEGTAAAPLSSVMNSRRLYRKQEAMGRRAVSLQSIQWLAINCATDALNADGFIRYMPWEAFGIVTRSRFFRQGSITERISP